MGDYVPNFFSKRLGERLISQLGRRKSLGGGQNPGFLEPLRTFGNQGIFKFGPKGAPGKFFAPPKKPFNFFWEVPWGPL